MATAMHPGGAPEPRDPLAEETSRARSELPRRRRPWPLRWALVVPFTAVLVAVVGLILWLSLRNGREAVEDVASDLRSELILRIWQYLDDYLETHHRLNALNADALLEGQLDPGDPPALDRHFWRQLQHFETVSFVFYGSPAGGAAGAGRIADGTLYLHTPDGFGKSVLGNIVERTLKVSMTARNWNTVRALQGLADAL